MRQFRIDELTADDKTRLQNYLRETTTAGTLDGTFWLPLPDELLSAEQFAHRATCGPYCYSIIVEEGSVTLELLVRSRSTLHCSCIAFATPAQREFLLQFLDRMLHDVPVRS